MSTTPPPLDLIPVTASGSAVTANLTAQMMPPLPAPVPSARRRARPAPVQVVPTNNDELQSEEIILEDLVDALTLTNEIFPLLSPATDFLGLARSLRNVDFEAAASDIQSIATAPPSLESIQSTSSATSEDRSLNTAPEVAVDPVGRTPEMSLGSSSSPSSNDTESSSSSVVADPWAGHDSPYALGVPPENLGFHAYPENFEIPTELLRRIKKKKVVPNSDKLSRKKDYYIVPWLGKFHYYKIQPVVERNASLYEFTVKPDTRKEGFVAIGKDLYYVTFKDLIRGVIRKSRKLEIKSGSTYADLLDYGNEQPAKSKPKSKRAGATNTVLIEQGIPETTIQPEDQSRLIADFGLDLIKSVDLASQIQERALHAFILEEEEW